MRAFAVALGGLCILFALCAPAGAQELRPLSTLETRVACSSPASLNRPAATAPRVLGSQDTTARTLLGPRDLLVIDSGSAAGVQLGQRFFVRRENRYGGANGMYTLSARTLAWIRIIAVDDAKAVATVEHLCDGIMADDYLEPFAIPEIPADAAQDDARGEPDFAVLSRVVAASDDRNIAAPGDVVMIEAGVGGTLAPGTRLAVYRDVRVASMPLVSVGEAVVVGVGPNVALARITRARDAVLTGDYMVVRK